jgi:hypothetical protein
MNEEKTERYNLYLTTSTVNALKSEFPMAKNSVTIDAGVKFLIWLRDNKPEIFKLFKQLVSEGKI